MELAGLGFTSQFVGLSPPFPQMQKYYKMKEEYPEIFKVSPPSEMKFMLEMQIQTMLPKKDEHGRQIYLFRVGASTVRIADVNLSHLHGFVLFSRKM